MLTRLQEISLIARCVAADDRHAFGELVEAYSDNLRRFLLSLTKGDVSLEMERIMEAMGNAVKAERVLQVNLDHPAIKNLKTLWSESSDYTDRIVNSFKVLRECADKAVDWQHFMPSRMKMVILLQ